MGNASYSRGSVENVHCPVTADVDLEDSMTVAIAIGRTGETYTWLAGTWDGAVGTTRTAVTATPVTFSLAAYPRSLYSVYVKVTDAPETPIIHAGQLTIT